VFVCVTRIHFYAFHAQLANDHRQPGRSQLLADIADEIDHVCAVFLAIVVIDHIVETLKPDKASDFAPTVVIIRKNVLQIR